MQNYLKQQQINTILEIIIEAGDIAIDGFNQKNFDVFIKSDSSKVSSIDLAISRLISAKLAKIFPNIPIVCEENNVRQIESDIFFLIDPIDGTSSFINDSSEFCINIALINNFQPVFGIIYAPMIDGGKIIFCDARNQIIKYNHRSKKTISIKNSNNPNLPDILKIITSSKTNDHDIEVFVKQFYPNFVNNYSVEKMSSAIKFFKIVEEEANLYLHLRKSMEWDTASGSALLKIIGFKLNKLEFDKSKYSIGDELQYKKNNFINSKFVVATFENYI